MLTADQAEAKRKIDAFLSAPEGTSFLLEGGAGVGKTYLVSDLLKERTGRDLICVCAPTHKAVNVLRRKLDAVGLEWMRGYDDYTWNGEIVTGTTAQLLGVSPVIEEEQKTTELKFARTGRGILSKITPRLLIIDEVSMLSWPDFRLLHQTLKKAGAKLLAVGDEAQLPPVKQKAIPFDKVLARAALRQIVRQAEGSAIVKLAWAIRESKPWMKIKGDGIERSDDLVAAFLELVEKPSFMGEKGWHAEEQRPVFIAYRNRVVDAAQEAACKKLYGHSHRAFAPGEMVLCETNLYYDRVLIAANQDELIVERFEEEHRDPVLGVPVVLRHRAGIQGSFRSSYLAPEELARKDHPYNVELSARLSRARALEEKKRSTPEGWARQAVNDERRKAWVRFFEWRDQTIISFRHPFAITSHKSQGSTYHTVFADAGDLSARGTQALYVAVTRPKERLVLP